MLSTISPRRKNSKTNSPRTPRSSKNLNKRSSPRRRKSRNDISYSPRSQRYSPIIKRKSSSPRNKSEYSSLGSLGNLLTSSSNDSPRYENFERIRKLGRGGSGSDVWKVRLEDGSDCCMKEMINTHVSAVDEFENEVRALKKITNCPNLIKFINFTKSLTTLRLFTSLYDGELSSLISIKKQKEEMFQVDEIIDYMYQLSSALAVLHNRRIMHRDIKSCNIFYDRLDNNKIRLVIGDFGEAKIISKKSLASTCRGTPIFSAPEVLSVKETGAYTFAADIWSLGMVMYELMIRDQPYHEIEGFGYMYNIQKGILPVIDMINEETYMELIPVWEEILSFDPIDRPSAGSLMMRLKSVEGSFI